MTSRTFTVRALFASASLSLFACEPELVVGKWVCLKDDASVPDKADPVALPWSTGFEHDFCDYERVAGFCYGDGDSPYETVTSPVHSGRYAAAFSVNADAKASQARCVRQGALPVEAYYGAWYFIPEAATKSAVWNLFHFQGGDTSSQHGLWDVSLINVDADLHFVVWGFLRGFRRESTAPVPIGEWFHMQLYLKRAADATGEIALYINGERQFEAKNLITDDTDFGQWYVGNYGDALMPSRSTLYVDDVTIGSTL